MLMRQGKRTQRSTARPVRKQQTDHKESRVNRLLVQTIVSAVLFLLVFVGGGLIPDRVCDVFGEVNQAISGESTLLESVQTLGSAVAEGEGLGAALKQWCVDTFLPTKLEEETDQTVSQRLDAATLYADHLMPSIAVPEPSPLE